MKFLRKFILLLPVFLFLAPLSASAHTVNGSAMHVHGIETPLSENPLFGLLFIAAIFLIGYLIKKNTA